MRVYECFAEVKKGICSHWANEHWRKYLNKAQSAAKGKEIPRFLRDLRAEHCIKNSPVAYSILIQLHEIHILTPS